MDTAQPANVLSERGDFIGSRRLQEQALAIHRRIGDRGGEAGSLGNIANLLQYQGDFAGARRMHEQALAIFRDVGEKGPAAIELNNLAIVLAAQGDLKAAHAMLEEALAIKRETGNRSSIAFTLPSSAAWPPLRAISPPRGGITRRPSASARRWARSCRAAQSRLSLATLSLDEGQAAEAERSRGNGRGLSSREDAPSRGPPTWCSPVPWLRREAVTRPASRPRKPRAFLATARTGRCGSP